MKSSIKVELGPDNKPVIRMRVCPSDDVRDILFQQFKETFGHENNLCSVYFDSRPTIDPHTILEITPLPPLSHCTCHYNVENIYHHLQGLSLEGAQVSMITSGEHIWFENQGTGAVSNELEREQLRILTLPSLVAVVSDAFERVISKESNITAS